MIYKTYEELKYNDLKLDDKIIFKHNGKEYLYHVCNSYLSCLKVISPNKMEDKYYDNDAIFLDLNIDPYDFCEMHYTSCPKNFHVGIFPYYNKGDFISAKNVVLALFLYCNDFKSNKNIWED